MSRRRISAVLIALALALATPVLLPAAWRLRRRLFELSELGGREVVRHR